MVVTRSQSGEEERRGRVFEDPPRSPSTTEPSTRTTGRRIAEASSAARQLVNPTLDTASDERSAPIAPPSTAPSVTATVHQPTAPATVYYPSAVSTTAPASSTAAYRHASTTAVPPAAAAASYEHASTAVPPAAAAASYEHASTAVPPAAAYRHASTAVPPATAAAAAYRHASTAVPPAYAYPSNAAPSTAAHLASAAAHTATVYQSSVPPATAPGTNEYMPTAYSTAHPAIARMAERSPDRSVRSGHSRASSSAVRIRQAELTAMEKLAEIQRRELRLEADLVQKKLAFEIAHIEDEESETRSVHNQHIDRVSQWLQQHEPTTSQPTELPSTVITAIPVVHVPQIQTPVRNNTAHLHPIRREQVNEHVQEQIPQRVIWEDTPRRPRSPPPTQQRSRSANQGIEQLAEAITKMARGRVPPKQVIELPTFSGSPSEWLSFKAAMRDSALIYQFSDVENMARLRNSLKGEAREAVRALLHTCSDPEVIMKTLEQCFGRPEIIIDQALDDIRKLPRPGVSATDLNNLAIKLQNIVQVLSSLDEQGYLHNPMLSREVIEKLSPHLRSRWCDYAEENHKRHGEPQIVTLSKFLMKEADRALKYSYAPSSATSSRNMKATDNATTARRRESTRKANTFTVNTTEPANNGEEQCLYCGAQHKVPQCEKFKALSLNERWEWVKEKRICFKCINKTHRRSNCRVKSCGVGNCSRPHHSLLHATPTMAPTTTEATSSNDGTVLTVKTDTESERTVLLKVCPVTIAGPGGEIKTYALLDEGSSASLINAELARKINARGPSSSLNIRGINTSREMDSRRVKFILKTAEQAHEIKAWTIEGLTLSNQTVPARLLDCEHLRDLPVENLTYKSAIPQILIGADNWELIVTRELRTGRKAEPAASKTQLGWVIHGSTPKVIIKDEASVLHIYVKNMKSYNFMKELKNTSRLKRWE